MKKWSVVLSVLMIAVLLLGACGGDNNAGTAGDSNVDSSTVDSSTVDSSDKPSGEQVTLKFVGWEVSPLETESVKQGLDTFMKQNPDIKVEYTTIPGGDPYIAKMQANMVGNESPDVFFLQSDYYRDFIKRESLLNLSAYVENDFSLDDLIPSALEISQVNGEFYGIESCTVSPVLYYNKDIFDKAGIDYPPSDMNKAWTWDEFLKVASDLTIKNGDKVEQHGVYGFENYYMTIAGIISNGGNWFTDDNTKSAANTPEVKDALIKIKELRTKYGVSPEGVVLQNSGMSAAQMLQTGKIAMLIDGSWALQELSNMKFPIGVAVLPKLQDAVTHGQAHLHVAWANTKYPEQAWKLIKFLSSEEYQLQNVKAGLWMPNRKSFYSEEGIAKWLTPGVHPEGFKELIPYFINSKVYPYAVLGAGVQKISADTTEELDKFFLANQDIDTTVQNIEQRVNETLAKQ